MKCQVFCPEDTDMKETVLVPDFMKFKVYHENKQAITVE